MNLKPVNIAVVDKETIVKADVLRSEKVGSAVKIKAIPNAKYILAEGENGVAPENITLKRVGKDLFVLLEGTDEDQPQLIIEGYFDNPGELVGKGEDGQWHEYIATDGDDDHKAAFLLDGESSAQALGTRAIAGLDGLAVAGTAFSPALLALGALAGIGALVGLGAIIRHNRDNGGDNNGAVAPVQTPTLTDVHDDVGTKTGTIPQNGVTDDATPTFSGTGTPGDIVEFWENNQKLGETRVNPDGSWTWTPEIPLSHGDHSIVLIGKGPDGRTSAPSDSFDFTVDLEAPVKPVIGEVEDDVGAVTGPIHNGDATDDKQPVFRGEGATPGDTVRLIVDDEVVGTAIVGEDGKWEVTPEQPLPEGSHSGTVIITDPAGNDSEPSDDFKFIVVPEKPVIGVVEDDVGTVVGPIQNGGATDDTQPTFRGEGATPGDTVKLIIDDELVGTAIVGDDGKWAVTPDNPLPEGEHVGNVVIADPSGNAGEPSDDFKFIVDLDPPTKPVIGEVEDDLAPRVGLIKDGDTTDDTLPVFRGDGGTPGDKVELIIDDKVVGTAIVGDDGKWEATPENPLPEGEHEAVVVIRDPVGNPSEPSDPIGFIVDITPPTKPTIDSVFDNAGLKTGNLANGDITDDSTPDFSGTAEKNSIVHIIVNGREVDSVTADPTGKWTWTPSPVLTNGHYDVRVIAEDKAGLRSDPSDAFSFDLVAGGIPTAPAITDVIDDVDAYLGTVQQNGITNDDKPTITGTGQDGTTVYLYDGTSPDPIGSAVVIGGTWTVNFDTPLSQGEHRFRAVAENAVGNRSPETGEWVIIVDSVDPLAATDIELWDDFGTPGVIANDDTTDDNTPTYRGKGEPGGTAIIDLGNGTTVRVPVDGTGSWSYTPAPALADGDYTWKVSIEDKAGNSGPASDPIHFIVDTSRNGVSISHVEDDEGELKGNLASGSLTDDTTPTVVGRATPGAEVKVYVDGKLIDSVIADPRTGEWRYTISPALPADGTYKISASENTGSGDSAQTAPFDLTLDTRVPVGSFDRVSDDVGLVQDDLTNPAVTDDTTPTLHGTGVAGDVVFIYDGTNLLTSFTVSWHEQTPYLTIIDIMEARRDLGLLNCN